MDGSWKDARINFRVRSGKRRFQREVKLWLQLLTAQGSQKFKGKANERNDEKNNIQKLNKLEKE